MIRTEKQSGREHSGCVALLAAQLYMAERSVKPGNVRWRPLPQAMECQNDVQINLSTSFVHCHLLIVLLGLLCLSGSILVERFTCEFSICLVSILVSELAS